MILRDVDNIKVGSTSVNKVYQGGYKVYDKNKIALEGYCKQGVPSEYQQVEYIESTGTQWINTGFPLFNYENHEIIMDFAPTEFFNYNTLFGTGIGPDIIEGWIYVNSGLACRYNYVKYCPTDYQTTINTRYLLDIKKEGTTLSEYIDNNLIGTATASTVLFDQFLYLLKSGEDYGKHKLYNCKLYSNGTLVRNFIPCYRKSDSVIGLYDLVNNVFYTNAGTGTFNKGADVPNPNYPQEIEVMEGKQVVNVSSENVLPNNTTTQTINGITFTKNKNGSITLNGTATNYCDFYFVGNSGTYAELEIEDGNYNLNGCINGSGKTYMLYAVQNRNGNLYYYPNYYENGIVIDIKENDTFRIFIRVMIGQTLDNVVIKPQLNKGTNALPYVPYKSQDFEVDLKSKNLYEGSQDFSGTWNNDSFWISDTNTYNGLVVKKRTGQWYGISKDINVESGKTYTFSCYIKSDSARPIGIYSSGGTSGISLYKQLNTTDSWERYSFTITASASGTVRFRIENTTSVAGNYTYICGYQFEENSIATDYEPYYNYKLAGIGEYKDNIYTKKGKWYVKPLLGKVVLDGSKSGSIRSDIQNENTICYRTDAGITNIKSNVACLSNYFECKNDTSDTEHIRYIGASGYRFQIFLLKTTATTAEQVQTWLSTHNTEVYYVLETPTEEEITSPTLIQQLNRLYQAM